jgi:hypothetical protein
MTIPTERWADTTFQKVYLSAVSAGAQSVCAPFWWSVAEPVNAAARILHNGTICYICTGSRFIGVTANHVYQKYLDDVEQFGRVAIECQFAGSTIYPEQRLIDRNKLWDLATFDIPRVFVSASERNPKAHHHPVTWPPVRVQKSDVLFYGGFPGVLREVKGEIAELPFQWVAGRASEITAQNIVLEPSFATMNWQGSETNSDPGGWSGGPVFRSVEEGLIARLEIVGFIYEFPLGQAVLARHVDVVLADGSLVEK